MCSNIVLVHVLSNITRAEFAKVDKSDPEDKGLDKTFEDAEQIQYVLCTSLCFIITSFFLRSLIMMRNHRLINRHGHQIAALESMLTE